MNNNYIMILDAYSSNSDPHQRKESTELYQNEFETETGLSMTYDIWSEKYQEYRQCFRKEYFDWLYNKIDEILKKHK